MNTDSYVGLQYKREGLDYPKQIKTRLKEFIVTTSKNLMIDWLNDDIYSNEIGMLVNIATSPGMEKRNLAFFANSKVNDVLKTTGVMKLKNFQLYEKAEGDGSEVDFEARQADLEQKIKTLTGRYKSK